MNEIILAIWVFGFFIGLIVSIAKGVSWSNGDVEGMDFLATAFMFIVFVAVSVFFMWEVDDLGRAICEEEFGMDFVNYDSWEDDLLCVPFEKEEKKIKSYDGLNVEIGERK